MQRLRASVLVSLCLALPLSTPPASAAGGNGRSYCSNASGPGSNAAFTAGPFGAFANPGEVVSQLVGILWGQGVGAPQKQPGFFTSTICSAGNNR